MVDLAELFSDLTSVELQHCQNLFVMLMKVPDLFQYIYSLSIPLLTNLFVFFSAQNETSMISVMLNLALSFNYCKTPTCM